MEGARSLETKSVSSAEKAMLYVLGALALTLPFDGYALWGLGSLFRLLGIFVLLLFLFLFLVSPRIRHRAIFVLTSADFLLLLLFVIWAAITTSWALNVGWALTRLQTYFALLVAALAIATLSVSSVARLWSLMLIGALVSLPLGFVLPHPDPMLAASGRFSSGGKDPNDYANLVLIAFTVFQFGALPYLRVPVRRFLAPLSWTALVTIILSASRTALVNGVLVLGLGFANFRFMKRNLVPAIVAVAATIAYLTLDSASPFVQRLNSLANIREEETWAGRIDLWRAAWEVFLEHPLTGVGVANFAWVSPYYSMKAASMIREDGSGAVAHNSFLSVLAETGVIGFLLFSMVQMAFFLRAFRNRNFHPLAKGLMLGLLSYWIASLTLTWEYNKIAFFLYGSILAFARRKT